MSTRGCVAGTHAATFLLASLLLLPPTPARAWQAACAGYLNPGEGKEPWLDCHFGIEQLQEGKPRDERYQQWHLSCEAPAQGQSSCELERIIFDMFPEDMGGAEATFDKHSTAEGTLRMVDGRWQDGVLDFDVVMGEITKDVMHVVMRVKGKGLALQLESFKAVGVGRGGAFGLPDGKLETVEFRIPEYTHSLKVPIVLRGMKSDADKRHDDMVNGLSPGDRKLWEATEKTCWRIVSDSKLLLREVMAQLPPHLRKKAKAAKQEGDLTPEENALLKDTSSKVGEGKFDTCLRDQGVSDQGRQRIIAWMHAEFFAK
jgi:hypothetical protein